MNLVPLLAAYRMRTGRRPWWDYQTWKSNSSLSSGHVSRDRMGVVCHQGQPPLVG